MRDWTPKEIQSIGDRLRRARLNAGFARATDAARQHGWNYSRYMNYENGERALPPKQAILIATAYGVTVDYIYFGKSADLNKIERNKALSSQFVRGIPLVGLGNIDELKRIASGSEPMLAASVPVSEDDSLPQNAIFIEIEDKSMSNHAEWISFEEGDKVLIEVGATPRPGEFVLALVREEETALFRLYREIERAGDGSIVADLVPLNPNFRVIRLCDANAGDVIGVCRRVHRIVDFTSPRRSQLGPESLG